MKSTKTISTEELERKVDDGEEILAFFDTDNPVKPNKTQRLTLDLPDWTVAALDKEAVRIGITRPALIKTLMDAGLRSAGHRNAPQWGRIRKAHEDCAMTNYFARKRVDAGQEVWQPLLEHLRNTAGFAAD